MLLSFERPAAPAPPVVDGGTGVVRASRPDLENCTVGQLVNGYHRDRELSVPGLNRNHRQDSKGTRWIPRHQESMKGVDDCDKPRLGVEQPLTRGFPNGETQRR